MTKKSPWATIWVHPRATIRRIVNENPNQSIWLLAWIYGFSALLGSFQSFSLGSSLGIIAIFIIALVLAPLWGYIVFTVWSWVVLWTGKWLKGTGSFQEVRAAYAWSNVPIIVSDVIWIIMLVMFGARIFVTQADNTPAIPQGFAIGLLGLLFIKVVFSIWSLVIYLIALSEVHRFSVMRAIGNVIISAIIVGIVMAVFGMLGVFMMGSPSEQTPKTAAVIFQLFQ